MKPLVIRRVRLIPGRAQVRLAGWWIWRCYRCYQFEYAKSQPEALKEALAHCTHA